MQISKILLYFAETLQNKTVMNSIILFFKEQLNELAVSFSKAIALIGTLFIAGYYYIRWYIEEKEVFGEIGDDYMNDIISQTYFND